LFQFYFGFISDVTTVLHDRSIYTFPSYSLLKYFVLLTRCYTVHLVYALIQMEQWYCFRYWISRAAKTPTYAKSSYVSTGSTN